MGPGTSPALPNKRVRRRARLTAASLSLGAGLAHCLNADKRVRRACRDLTHLPARVRAVVFLVAVGVLAAASSAGATFGFSWAPGGDALAAGTTARLTWSLPPGHDHGFGEMELVLSLDGGRTFPFRVTREFSPAKRALDWRVPALSSRCARLALRAGNDGEPEDEEVVFVSEEFAIKTGAFSPLEPTVFLRGEWHTVEALEEDEDTSQPFSSVHSEIRPTIAPVGHLTSGSKRLPRPAATEKSTSRAAAFRSVALTDPAAHRPCLPRVPADSPRRE